uniref:Uncharacterized protein n=1 Tax=Anguilla anguilla TaxID=7936 RepID=A0A0E9W186_ANGAN
MVTKRGRIRRSAEEEVTGCTPSAF